MPPRYGGMLKSIVIIKRPAVVRQIPDHLGLWTVAPSFRTPPDPSDAPATDQPREWSYEPVLDDLSIPDPVWHDRKAQGPVCPRPAPFWLRAPGIPLELRLTPPADW